MGWCAVLLVALWPAARSARADDPGDKPAAQSEEASGNPPAAQSEAASGNASCADIGSTIDFKTDSAALDENGKKTLDGVAAWMGQDTERKVVVEGYADHPGPTEYNQALSEKRAEMAKEYLTAQGIDEARITATGRGELAQKPQVEDRRAVEVRTCALTCQAIEEPAPAPVAEEAPPPPMEEVPAAPAPEKKQRPLSRVGVGAALGGGVTGFTDQEARDFTDPGGSWEARLSFGTRTPVAFEAAYIGSAQNVEALGLDSDAVLVGNGAEGTVRVNILQMRVQPYVFGGLGWTHYNVSDSSTATSSIRDSDDILEVPFGVGLSFRVAQSLLLDLRGTGRAAFYENMFDAAVASNKEARLHSWNVGGRIGWEF
jgi:peptidoglycan-associated lipoprotein